ncbi:transcriptional protein SWT1 isoform X2 [Conger conger]|uniref:transcriptional protein SWT1 isoform X2 n=1 Tax=Conger conger TaxID=82655 RepID=UPI002A5B0588|nr:transcriptional protein SWT1 isoform X2 [Conger conger]
MSKKKKKKKQKDRSPTSSSYERNDESFKEKEYRKTKETSKREHYSDFHVRPMQDEAGRPRQVDSLPSPKKNLAESSPRKERLYKKPVYRLGTVSHSEKEKDRNKEVKEKQSTTSSTCTLENDSKRPHCTKKSPPNPTAAGESTRKRVSEELREERKQLVKRRSKEPLESKGFVQFSLRKEHSQEPKGKPAAFKTVNVSTTVSKEPHRHSESSKPSGSTQEEKQWLNPHKRLQFKIPKKTSAVVNKDKVWENSLLRDYKRSITEKVPRRSPPTANVFSACTFSSRKSKEKAKPSCEVNPTASIFVGAFSSPSERHKESRSTDNKRATALNSTALPENAQNSRVSSKATETYDGDQEVITELHKARSQKLLEVNVVDSYGELTRMDIDPPEEIKAFSFSTEQLHQDLLIILDTNILLSHLDFVKKMRTHGLGALGFPHILIPWVVMQELDSLKQGKLSSSVEHKARPAVHYIYTTLKNQEPRLWGQSMQQASQRICGLDAESNDDRVLHCCLQYQGLYPGAALILCTNDKNLCSKALLSGVKALSKTDLESEVERLHSDPQAHCRQPVPNCWPAHTAEDWKPSQIHEGGESNRSKAVDEEREVSTSVSVLEEALRGALSLVLESEMKAAFDDLWLEVVILKPPWTLPDLFHCFKKHWIAVFGNVIKRNLLGSVECLNDSLCKDKMVDRISINLAAREAHRLLHAFSCRPDYGKNLTEPLAVLEQLLKDTSQSSRGAEQTSGSRTQASSDGDVLMAVEEDGVADAQPSYHEVWAVFENIWNNVCQISSAVFTALQFIPGTLETSMPSNGPPPPEEALSCLHKLIFTVRQLLESLQRVLLSKSSFEDVQGLLAFISSCEIATMKPSFTAEDLFKCLSQQEYREKLRVGGSQLMDLSSSLDRCASAVGQRAGSSSWC